MIARAAAGLSLVAIAAYATRLDFVVERELFAARATGYLALIFLLAALAVSPIARVTGWAAASPRLRRSLGLASAALAFAHAAYVWSTPLVIEALQLVAEPQLRAGATALAILLVLALTSFPLITRAVRVRLWKPLHRLAYAAAAISVHHLALSPEAPPWAIAAAASGLALLLLARLAPKRPAKRGGQAERFRAGAGV